MRPTALRTLALFALCAALPGCTSTQPSSPFLQAVARNVKTAQIYDRGERAMRAGDLEALHRAVAELKSLGAGVEAYHLSQLEPFSEADREVIAGSVYFGQAAASQGEQRSSLERRAARHFRRSLELEPEYDSPYPELLNSLGYFLADQGTSPSDYALAEKLTRRAVGILDNLIDAETRQGVSSAANRNSRAIIRDSLAWALYRLKRYDEALKEQREAVREARESGERIDPELESHLAEIERAVRAQRGLTPPAARPAQSESNIAA